MDLIIWEGMLFTDRHDYKVIREEKKSNAVLNIRRKTTHTNKRIKSIDYKF